MYTGFTLFRPLNLNSCWVGLIRVITEVPEGFHKLSRQFEESNRQLQQVETALGRIPSDEVLKPLIQELSNLHQQLGGLQKQVDDEDGEYSVAKVSSRRG